MNTKPEAIRLALEALKLSTPKWLPHMNVRRALRRAKTLAKR